MKIDRTAIKDHALSKIDYEGKVGEDLSVRSTNVSRATFDGFNPSDIIKILDSVLLGVTDDSILTKRFNWGGKNSKIIRVKYKGKVRDLRILICLSKNILNMIVFYERKEQDKVKKALFK